MAEQEGLAVKLEKLAIGEVSGVDRPANGADGWLVLKGARDAQPLLKAAWHGDTLALAIQGGGAVVYGPSGARTDFDADGVCKTSSPAHRSPTTAGGESPPRSNQAQPRDANGQFAARSLFRDVTPAPTKVGGDFFP